MYLTFPSVYVGQLVCRNKNRDSSAIFYWIDMGSFIKIANHVAEIKYKSNFARCKNYFRTDGTD